MQGGEKVVPLKGQGALVEVETTDAWDGLDGALEEEEEFDLSELDEE